ADDAGRLLPGLVVADGAALAGHRLGAFRRGGRADAGAVAECDDASIARRTHALWLADDRNAGAADRRRRADLFALGRLRRIGIRQPEHGRLGNSVAGVGRRRSRNLLMAGEESRTSGAGHLERSLDAEREEIIAGLSHFRWAAGSNAA